MNKCMMQIIDVIDKLDSMPNDKHLHIIVDTIDDDKKDQTNAMYIIMHY